jgi:DNA polymerase I-like protein with 3'-5' exonuclease and polymerase domains
LSAPFERLLVIDFETAWCSKTYTLSKMTTEEYVRDQRFKAWGLVYRDILSGDEFRWVKGHHIQAWAHGIDWSTTGVLAHNAQFDVTCLAWRFGAQPCFIIDTLSMARALRGVNAGNSLAKLAEDFGLPPKGRAVHSTDGMLDELPAHVEQELADYCVHDAYLCEELYRLMSDGYSKKDVRKSTTFPKKELRLIDLTMKMYVRPLLELDQSMLVEAIDEERERRESLLARLNVEEATLASNDMFADVLRKMGVEPPQKKKKATAKTPNPVGLTWAFAKNDAMFQALLNGDNEDVALLCEARLKVKSTMARTRAIRFHDIAKRGRLPVPLSYFGAATGRWTASKGSAINMQNLKRGSFLRKSIMAPEDHELVVGDLSQIEPRVLAWLADYTELLDIFRAGGDPYASFGAQMFNIPGMTKESHPDLRQSAKSALLGCGYQLGWASFAAQLLTGFLGAPPVRYDKPFAKKLGVTADYVAKFIDWDENVKKMMEIPRLCTDDELLVHCVAAKMIIDKYRTAAWPVVQFWQMLETLIATSLFGGEERTYKCLTFRKEEIVLPSGLSIHYPNLRQVRSTEPNDNRMVWVYGEGKDISKLYAGKVCNNVTQAVARIVMTDGMLRVAKRVPIAGTVHDELIAVAHKSLVAAIKPWVLAEMTKEPPYLPGIPLAADGGAHRRYGMAKN